MPPSSLTLACACQTITGTIPLPPSTTSLPLPLELCHCASCRHSSGQLAITCFPCPRFPPNSNHNDGDDNGDGAPTLSITSATQPSAYKTSEDLIRYFCPKCGASIYIESVKSGDVEVCSGVLGDVKDGKEDGKEGVESVVRFARHIFLGGTGDGGLGVWVEGPRWRGWPDSEVFEVPEAGEGGGKGGGGEKREKRRLQGYCHCRGVEFYVTPPNNEDEDDKHAEFSSGAEKDDPQKWYLRATGTKYLAGLCACNSCRLATGHDLQAWAFIPHSHIHQPDGTIFDLHPEGKGATTTTLKTYSHTPGANRGFCGRCGATVFWSHKERRGDVIDISVGLLEQEGGGARAEGWLEWRTDKVSFAECALNKELVGMVVEGLGKWGESRKVGG